MNAMDEGRTTAERRGALLGRTLRLEYLTVDWNVLVAMLTFALWAL